MGQTLGKDGEFKTTVELKINDVSYTVPNDIPTGTSLNVFIRDYALLKGTKSMCFEGGCGACIVAAQINGKILAVNSCLVPILICNGWEIKTIEGIGGKEKGYHPIQATLAQMNGSQCGYCSSGMVMNMYSLLQRKQLTMKEIENSFGSNICRCTGYRPILDAFKTFATDADLNLKKKLEDIEEIYRIKTCPKTGQLCNGICPKVEAATAAMETVYIALEDSEFYKVVTIEDLFRIFEKHPKASYVMNGGNTAHGVYRLQKKEIYIDINSIPDLHRIEQDGDTLVLGAAVSLTEAMEDFVKLSKEHGFEYLQHLAAHIDLIASVPIRNIGTLAGNLMIKHQHNEFPSDLFLILETAGAQLHILETPWKKSSMSMIDFLKTDMNHKLIYSIILPKLSNEYEFRSYKIMPRAQNAHAHVNAGFLFKVDDEGKLLERPNIIIGGIRHDFLHASETEKFLVGKCILKKQVFQDAMNILSSELNPDHVLPDYSPQFRKVLAEGLFYKFVLSIRPDSIDPKLRSGGTILQRGLSSGKQDFDTDRYLWPLNKPMPKLESVFQTSGEAEYINDIPPQPKEVFCAFVLSDVANRAIESIDSSKALEMKGVIAFYTAKDIPGKNLCINSAANSQLFKADEPLLADKNVLYAGQQIGIVVATTNTLANEAVKKVKVNYTSLLLSKPILSIKDAITSNEKARILQTGHVSAKHKVNNAKHVIKGDFECGGQYHYTMEPQTCVCIPVEDGIDVHSSTQWMDLIQVAIADCLDIQSNRINVKVRRLGGGYGAKVTRSAQVACACALVCHKLHRPARLIMPLESMMQSIGKRAPALIRYEVGVNDDGVIQYLNSTIYSNSGSYFNDLNTPVIMNNFCNCYDNSTWNYVSNEVNTDLPSSTYCRGPGAIEGVAMVENIMEHIARVVGKDPVEVRLSNINKDDEVAMRELVDDLKRTSKYDSRKTAIAISNTENRWKKRGMSMVVMKYPLKFAGQYNSQVSICAHDGTVCVSHGGIECGQGIHTKVAQVAAHTLGIKLEMVNVKPTNNLTTPNNTATGRSVSSESCAYATMQACKELLERVDPIKKELNNPTWEELVMAAYLKDVDLCARYMFTVKDNVKNYGIYGVAVTEVEVDILTGQHIIRRVDLIEDTGISMNPEIDLGQVEGSFIMGLGYWTSEDLHYDPSTGALTNDRTWNYKPPGAKDIPVDFRVAFRRNAPNPIGVLRSKAVGEPPICMSNSILFALRDALNAARSDSGNTEAWFPLDGPATTEKILLSSLTQKDNMVF